MLLYDTKPSGRAVPDAQVLLSSRSRKDYHGWCCHANTSCHATANLPRAPKYRANVAKPHGSQGAAFLAFLLLFLRLTEPPDVSVAAGWLSSWTFSCSNTDVTFRVSSSSLRTPARSSWAPSMLCWCSFSSSFALSSVSSDSWLLNPPRRFSSWLSEASSVLSASGSPSGLCWQQHWVPSQHGRGSSG